MDSLKISLIVPAFNEEKNLAGTLQSLLNQTYQNIELIVVDNNSSDKTGDIARQFTQTVLLETDPGYMCAVSTGSQKATGDFITFCDADTQYASDWLSKVMAAFSKHPNAVAVYGTMITYDASRFLNIFNYSVYTFLIMCSRYLFRFDNTSGFNFVIKKSAYDQVGGYRRDYRRMSPDIDLGKRLKKVGSIVLDLSICVGTSFRRFQKGGKVKTLLFFIKSWAEMVMGKEASESYDSYNQKAR